MALKELKKIKLASDELSRLQDNIDSFGRQFNKVISDGIILKDIELETTTVYVPHLLGRVYTGWQVIDLQGDARVWRDTTSTEDTSKFIPLKASATVTVNLWVF